jgi:hypothetical protein
MCTIKNIRFHVRETAWRNPHIDPRYLLIGLDFVSVHKNIGPNGDRNPSKESQSSLN